MCLVNVQVEVLYEVKLVLYRCLLSAFLFFSFAIVVDLECFRSKYVFVSSSSDELNDKLILIKFRSKFYEIR